VHIGDLFFHHSLPPALVLPPSLVLPLVSVLLPVWNGEGVVEEGLRSVMREEDCAEYR